jgi:hypothetical protein
MVAEIFAGLGAFKTMFDMAKALQGIHDATARDRAVIELQKEILTAQAAQSALIQTVSDLEKEVTRLKDWETDKSRYQLSELRPGIVALSIKPAMQNGEPFHHICADCAANGKKSYLQKHISGPYYDEFRCGGCKSTIGIDKGTPPSRPDDYEDDFISVRR